MEASIVLPLLILIICALVYLSIFYFQVMRMQCDVQGLVIDRLNEEAGVIQRVQESGEYATELGPLLSRIMTKEYTAYRYEINESVWIRGGSLAEGIGDD